MFVQILDNRRTNSSTDFDFMIIVKKQADHFDFYKSRNSVTIPHESRLSIKFQNLTQEILYFIILNLTSFWQIKHSYFKHMKDQTVLSRNSEEVFSRLPSDFVKSLDISVMNRLEPRFTVSAYYHIERAR